jgi:hypothetical protein
MWEKETGLWNRCDYMDSTYYSPSNKQELFEKQAREIDLNTRFPKHIINGENIDGVESYENRRGI